MLRLCFQFRLFKKITTTADFGFPSRKTDCFPMTQIPPDDILEGLYKLRIRESQKLKTVLELYVME